MNSKITLPRLISSLAEKSGMPRKTCDEFMREFSSLIVSSLENGEPVKVRGLGSFRLGTVQPRKSVDVTTGEEIEIAGHTKVNFTPARELASAVNAPFEGFESIVLPAEISEADLAEAANTPINEIYPAEGADTHEEAISQEDAADSDDTVAFTETPIPADSSTYAEMSESPKEVAFAETSDAPEKVATAETSDAPEKVATSETSDTPEKVATAETSTYKEALSSEANRSHTSSSTPVSKKSSEENNVVIDANETPKKKRPNFFIGFLIGFACCAAVTAIVILLWHPNNSTPQPAPAETVNTEVSEVNNGDAENATVDEAEVATATDAELAEAVATIPSDANETIIDTITRTRYLTTMAKEHYGNFNLWPYIYMENSAKLGHPDRIRPGTPVAVPPLSKYGVNPSDPAAIEKAKKLGLEIYAKYK